MSYTVSVRELCAFTAKQGDLDLRFTPAPTALEGIAGHGKVASRRGALYEREIPLTGQFGSLRIRGRADGYHPDRNELEEIKTHRGAIERVPANHRALHWAQLKIYGALLCRMRKLEEIRLSLVYFDIVKERESVLTEVHTAEALDAFHDDHCARFLAWAEQQTEHRLQRTQQLGGLRFPHPDFHPGQRLLAEAVYRTGRDGLRLMAQAPTGIGKTVGTLFPLMKACAAGTIDRGFFLTAKSSGRQLALDALEKIQRDVTLRPLRVLEMTARDKACVNPDKACHGDSCPLAKGFYDRLPAARAAAITCATLDQTQVREVALAHSVCPYYLSQELARWSDVVVGDYNYYFDSSALLHSLSVANEWKTAVLVDEAHNLLERGRAMYSAEFDQRQLAAVRAGAPPALKAPLDRLNREWNRLHRDQEQDYQVYERPPQAFIDTLGKLTTALNEHFGEQPPGADTSLQTFYFACLNFRALADSFAAHSIFDITLGRAGRNGKAYSTLCLRNIVPAPFLGPRIENLHSLVMFSATLSPSSFYRDMLGLPDTTKTLDVPSPFSRDQLSVQVVDRVSTRYRDRTQSRAPIVELMARQYAQRPGNYLAFFSSFEYLDEVADLFCASHPQVPTWRQSRGMRETDRNAFLQRFEVDGSGIGFAVLGGAFAEGVDLPGSRLIGAFVATLGLPQFNPVNEQMRQRMEQLFGQGYEYAYLYPGLQKVVQAAGRVIRTLTDRGVLILIDDRYAQGSVRDLLPSWWHLQRAPRVARPQPEPIA